METVTAARQQEFSTDLLRVYYDRIFPYGDVFRWLAYSGGSDYFINREWSFTMEDDIYMRYQCFRDDKEMKAAMQKKQPHKIDIGAVFNAPPKEHTTINPDHFKTVERELVFDIDMTDYDDIRTCCTGANICSRCWPFMTMSVKVLDDALRTDFGFEHILWIYSGRRGIHCWVCDAAARALPNEARSAVVEYLSVHTATNIADSSTPSTGPIKKSHKAALVFPFHPMVQRAYEILEPYFERNICDGDTGQGLLASKDKCIKVINTIPEASVKKELLSLLDSSKEKRSGAERWRQIKSFITSPEAGGNTATTKKRQNVNYKELEEWKVDLVLTYCYPRLDANVSKSQNHLLKAPFCVHPKTGRVCIPIDPSLADDFDPFEVPTLRVLCEQVDAYDKAHPGNSESDINKTAMKECMQTFQTTFMGAMASANKKELREKNDMLAAAQGDF